MIFYIGLVGSGKTTLYRKLNEEKTAFAVEIELPQSCRYDEELKLQLFNAYYHSPNIDAIIAHPYYLPTNFFDLINHNDRIIILPCIDIKERQQRVIQRAENSNIQSLIFPLDFYKEEDQNFQVFYKKYQEFIGM